MVDPANTRIRIRGLLNWFKRIINQDADRDSSITFGPKIANRSFASFSESPSCTFVFRMLATSDTGNVQNVCSNVFLITPWVVIVLAR